MLTIQHNRHWYEPRLPHLIFIDGMYAGTMHSDNIRIKIPAGSYSLRIQFGGRIPIGKKGKSVDLSVSSTEQLEIKHSQDSLVVFHDRERLWNILFDIDLAVWIVSFFVSMPQVYSIVSNTFFVIWIVRLIIIRKKYYKITHQSPITF